MKESLPARYWRGHGELWKIYWIYGVLGSLMLTAVFAWLVLGMQAGPLVVQILLLIFTVYSVWILVSVWRCAPNAKEPFWGALARWMTAAWAVNAAMLVLFLELDLVIARLL